MSKWDEHMVSISRVWSNRDDAEASSEGWSVFECDGELQINIIDDKGILVNDGEAYTLCCQKAMQGSRLHMLALYLDGRPASNEISVPKALLTLGGVS